jgi:hypothetical protein
MFVFAHGNRAQKREFFSRPKPPFLARRKKGKKGKKGKKRRKKYWMDN